jgi:hypothetical protein
MLRLAGSGYLATAVAAISHLFNVLSSPAAARASPPRQADRWAGIARK